MLKFIHAADIHLDSPLRGLSRYDTAPVESIRNACRNAFENMVDLAIEEKVNFVLLAGDIYDGDWKDFNTCIFLNRQIGKLGKNNISVFAVAGNHDAANKMTWKMGNPENMKLLSHKKVEKIKLEELGVVIHGRSYAKQKVEDNLSLDFPIAETGYFNIGLLHTSLDGRVGHDNYAPCSLDDLHGKAYQYWALGHVHKQEVVSENPWVVYSGCIQGRHIRETGAKGCMLVTVEEGDLISVEEKPLDVMRWSNCEIDLTDLEEMEGVLNRTREMIQQEYESADGRPLAMRILFCGTTGVSSQIAADPARFEFQIKALGAEMFGEELWIERVLNNTVGKLDLESVLEGDSAFSGLLREIMAHENMLNDGLGIDVVLEELRKKIPREATQAISLLQDKQNPQFDRLIEEAKQMLIGKLLTDGGAK